jgi:LPS O-antigen subunit length determinant protein (WzzB/FepE family)
MFDLVRVGIGTDFVEEVASSLKPGKVAVIAEIDEDWVTPVDGRMEALGGEVFRRARTEVVDDQISAEEDALKEEITELKAEASQAHGEAKAKVQKRLDAASARLTGLQSRARSSFENEKRQMDAKLRALQDRTAKAMGDAKAGFQRRIEKLRKAWEHTQDKHGADTGR